MKKRDLSVRVLLYRLTKKLVEANELNPRAIKDLVRRTTLHTCIVCGYIGLEYPQYTNDGGPMFNICPCCGFQSGYHDLDLGITIDNFRKKWISSGAEWKHQPQPENWNKKEQLIRINVKR